MQARALSVAAVCSVSFASSKVALEKSVCTKNRRTMADDERKRRVVDRFVGRVDDLSKLAKDLKRRGGMTAAR